MLRSHRAEARNCLKLQMQSANSTTIWNMFQFGFGALGLPYSVCLPRFLFSPGQRPNGPHTTTPTPTWSPLSSPLPVFSAASRVPKTLSSLKKQLGSSRQSHGRGTLWHAGSLDGVKGLHGSPSAGWARDTSYKHDMTARLKNKVQLMLSVRLP